MNWLKYKNIYFAISGILILISIFALFGWGLGFGVDFTGGSVFEYSFDQEISTEDLTKDLEESGFEVNSISATSSLSYLIKLPPLDPTQKDGVVEVIDQFSGGALLLRFETVGPTIGAELVKKTFYAIVIASVAILLWVAYQFKSLKFGAAAILAMFHDSFILIGSFAVLGHFLNVEVDFLVVTAVLTTLSFSVHDTIVVFDRIREINNDRRGGDLENVANKALSETMVRSLNNSFTIMFMLVALILLGGTTIRWFAVALLIGTMLGTYSSPFVAVPLLTVFDSWTKRLKK